MDILERINKVHSNKYDYIIQDYKNLSSKIKVICKEHGPFDIRCDHHLNGQGCKKCKKIKNGSFFIDKSNIIHNNKYEYSLVNYNGQNCKVEIKCKEHGVFEQTPYSHLSGSGCPKCFNKSKYNDQKLETENFIKISTEKHGDKFDYSKSVYINSTTKIEIICKKHGSFLQIPSSHLKFKESCPLCRRKSSKNIIESFNLKHQNKYDYSVSDFNDNTTTKSYIDIMCEKHGIFNQRINHHLKGTGCPKCNESQGEKIITNILIEIGLINNKDFFREKDFEGLIFENSLFFDFFIPKYNLCIEYDGEQHFKPVKIFGGVDAFNKIIQRDKIKNEYCLLNNIHLLRFSKKNKKDDIKNTILSFIREH